MSPSLQETKAVNGRLVAYLKKPDNLRKLVLYVIGQSPNKAWGSSARVRCAHAALAGGLRGPVQPG